MRIGTAESVPPVEEVVGALQRPDQNVIVSLAGLPTAERPTYCASLLPRIRQCGAAIGRPHWFVIDAAHDLLPTGWREAGCLTPREWPSVVLVAPDHDRMSLLVRPEVDVVVAVGVVGPQLAALLESAGVPAAPAVLPPGLARMWHRGTRAAETTLTLRLPAQMHQPEGRT